MGQRPSAVNCALSQCSRARALCRPLVLSVRVMPRVLSLMISAPPGLPLDAVWPPDDSGPIIDARARGPDSEPRGTTDLSATWLWSKLISTSSCADLEPQTVARKRQPDDTMVSRGLAANHARTLMPKTYPANEMHEDPGCR